MSVGSKGGNIFWTSKKVIFNEKTELNEVA